MSLINNIIHHPSSVIRHPSSVIQAACYVAMLVTGWGGEGRGDDTDFATSESSMWIKIACGVWMMGYVDG